MTPLGTTEQVVARYAALVRYYAGRFYGIPKEDRVQEGFLGLLRAIPRYDASRGASFATYARFWICDAIRQAVQARDVVRLPRRQQHRRREQASLHDPIGRGTLGDLVLAQEDRSAEVAAEAGELREMLERLRPRDREAVWQHVALGEMLRRVDTRLGIGGERTRQLCRRPLRELRKDASDRALAAEACQLAFRGRARAGPVRCRPTTRASDRISGGLL